MKACRVLPRCILTVLLCFLSRRTEATFEGTGGCLESEDGTCKIYPILGKPSEYTPSSTAGVKLAVRRWIPDVAIFVHGGAGFHSGYADIMGKSLQKAGIAVVAYDSVGSGYSDGMKGGKRNYVDSITTLTNDFTKILKDVRADYPGKKVFAIGESFGCFVLLAQIMSEQEQAATHKKHLADGYLLTGPVVKLLPEMLPPKPVIAVLTFVARFFPMLSMPGTDFFSTFDLAFGDKTWAQTGRSDPIIQEAALIAPRLGMIASVLGAMNTVYNYLEHIDVPFKILMGEKEGRVDVVAVKHLAKVSKSSDKSIEIVDGAYHQLFQDLPEVTSYVCRRLQEWMLERS